MPLVTFSAAMAATKRLSIRVGWSSATKPRSKGGRVKPPQAPLPSTASSQKPTMAASCSTPNNMSERYRLSRSMRAPPSSAPTMVSQMPMILLTMPTSAWVKAMPLMRKGVVRVPAKASPSL